MTTTDLPRKANKVLSIQSHVVHGYVGNKAAVFPLQTLNWDVDVLNSVNFSNHTGYGSWEGEAYTGEQIETLCEGLRKIGMSYDAILTGYVHGAECLRSVGKECIDAKRRSPSLLWVLDPVMGDEGEIYVGKDVIPVYQDLLKQKLCDVITPNQFELELLLDTKIYDLESLRKAVQQAHQLFGVKHIVISSLSLTGEQLGFGNTGHLYCCLSDGTKLTCFPIAKYDSYFTGVGDLFSALLLDRLYKLNDITRSVNEVLTVMSKVLYVTRELCLNHLGSTVVGKIGDPKTMKECELRIIECMNLYGGSECAYTPREI